MAMPAYRKEIQEWIIEKYGNLIPGSGNREIYINYFAKLSDAEFDAMMEKMIRDDDVFPFYSPNFDKEKLTPDRLFKLADEVNLEYMQRLWMNDHTTGLRHLTPIPYLVGEIPLRIQQQLLVKKQSEARDNNEVDDLTNQPRGESKGGSLSYPEFQVLYTMGLKYTIEEIFSVRGGDEKAFRAYTKELVNNGGVSINAVKAEGSKPKSAKTVAAVFNAMHLANNFA